MRPAPLFATAGLLLATLAAALAEPVEITSRRALERKTFSDAEIVEGFFRTAFGAELALARFDNRIRKFDGPVRVHVDNRVQPNRGAEVAAVVADIRARIQHLDIAMAETPASANVTVSLVRDRDLGHAIGDIYGLERARQIQRTLAPQCLTSFKKDDSFRIQQAKVIIVADAGEFIFRDCIYEELLQALGPINDTDAVPWTMFNDNVQLGFFGVYDQYILNILYDPRIRPGMDLGQVRAVLSEVLPDVRSFVARVNDLSR